MMDDKTLSNEIVISKEKAFIITLKIKALNRTASETKKINPRLEVCSKKRHPNFIPRKTLRYKNVKRPKKPAE